ncbi:uncharacterized protein LOC143210439 [Lasioglossum baleicum]|uniref:uncharacterized protein LOC143210439 n=1 Tax=Lasioglossum baleicum TaxID=434251 RepID=UPI003FCE8D59
MDEQYEHAITRVPIRKYARICNKCDNQPLDLSAYRPSSWIAKLPVEIILEILSYLSNDDLRAVRRVSVLFNKITSDPILWRTYEVTCRKQTTGQVLMELKRMSFLKKFSVTMRPDCDDILRQLSMTNRSLEELYVTNCTGMTSKLFLRSSHLISILERCRKLHTINISGSRFRGLKFYRLLGAIGPRVRSVCVCATRMQFFAFIMDNEQIDVADREKICRMCMSAKNCAPFYYCVTKKADRVCTVLINYLDKQVMLVNDDRSTSKLTIAKVVTRWTY